MAYMVKKNGGGPACGMVDTATGEMKDITADGTLFADVPPGAFTDPFLLIEAVEVAPPAPPAGDPPADSDPDPVPAAPAKRGGRR